MFINLSNHSIANWSAKQLDASKQYGELINMQFPPINPCLTSKELDELVDIYFLKILEFGNPVVMIQGEFVFTYRLVKRLKDEGIMVLASCSERRVVEYIGRDGCTEKRSEFEFAGFRVY